MSSDFEDACVPVRSRIESVIDDVNQLELGLPAEVPGTGSLDLRWLVAIINAVREEIFGTNGDVFDEERQDEPWQNEVAKELNILLSRAQFFRETSNDESDRTAERATFSIVRRVAGFESIKTVRELGPI